jgi:hypothetical protein
MNDLDREILLEERNKKRELVMEKYELLKKARAQQKSKDLVIINNLLIL